MTIVLLAFLVFNGFLLEGDSSFMNAGIESTYDFKGYLDKTLPIKIEVTVRGQDAKGRVAYGTNGAWQDIEGDVSEGMKVLLYEFNKSHRVSAIISGSLNDLTGWRWNNADYTMDFPITLVRAPDEATQVIFLVPEKESFDSHIFLRSAVRQIAINQDGEISLRWMDFICEENHCREILPNIELMNPLEFSYMSESGQEAINLYPGKSFKTDYTVEYKNLSEHQYEYFYSVNYPSVDDEIFESWIMQIIAREIDSFKSNIETGTAEDDMDPAQRLADRLYGDFYITHLSSKLISGFMMFHSSSSALKTIPFIYDMQRLKMISKNNLFKKNFDYPFFLKTYLDNQRRLLQRRENRLVQNILKEEPFSHMVLTPQGLLFFTNFHVVFGRRQIMIPYDEIKTFIDNKTVENYIRKNR